MKESQYERNLKKKLETEFPGCMILKNDAARVQGIPDLLILWGKHWASLETKRHKTSSKQPNQAHYVDLMNKMSYSSFVNPDNEEDVFNGLRKAFRVRRQTRVSQS
jgi:hypothetical protein